MSDIAPYVSLDPKLNSIQGLQVVERPAASTAVSPPPAPGESALETFLRKGSAPGRKTWSSNEFMLTFIRDLIEPILVFGLDEITVGPLLHEAKKHPELKLQDGPQLQLWNIAVHVSALLENLNRLPEVDPRYGTPMVNVTWEQDLFRSCVYGHKLISQIASLSGETRLASHEMLDHVSRIYRGSAQK
jgi:hypothetical protein